MHGLFCLSQQKKLWKSKLPVMSFQPCRTIYVKLHKDWITPLTMSSLGRAYRWCHSKFNIRCWKSHVSPHTRGGAWLPLSIIMDSVAKNTTITSFRIQFLLRLQIIGPSPNSPSHVYKLWPCEHHSICNFPALNISYTAQKKELIWYSK